MSLDGDSALVASGFDSAPEDPLELMRRWRSEAVRVGVQEPDSLLLATATPSGVPSSRVVLLKEIRAADIVFASSSASAKGRELASNPRASTTLWWRETVQQIHLAGPVALLSEAESDGLFRGRSREAQAVAICSQQSALLVDERELEERVAALVANSQELKRPATWHAYALEPTTVEFWHGRKNRLHRRLRYDLGDSGWSHHRLQP